MTPGSQWWKAPDLFAAMRDLWSSSSTSACLSYLSFLCTGGLCPRCSRRRPLPIVCAQYRTQGPCPFPHRKHFLWWRHRVSTKLHNGWTMNSTEGICHKGLRHAQVWVGSGMGSLLGWSVTMLLEQRTPETCWGMCRQGGWGGRC